MTDLPPRVAEVAAAARAAVTDGRLDLPLPGSGRTHERWRALVELAAQDLCVARLAEAHLDAQAVLAELDGPAPPPGSLWGVWAARPPGAGLRATRTATGWTLAGTKPWCSGARACTHALVTADSDDGYRLFAVDLAAAAPVPGTWHAVGMAGSDSLDVDFPGTPAQEVGGPDGYLRRPGFWHGAVAVAACWYGGAVGIGQALRAEAHRREPGPHLLAHLGAVDAALSSVAVALRDAAREVDADPQADLQQTAARVRAQAERVATEVLDRVGRATGAAPLCRDPRHALRAADLPVYLRQSHAEADLAVLGRLVLDADPQW